MPELTEWQKRRNANTPVKESKPKAKRPKAAKSKSGGK